MNKTVFVVFARTTDPASSFVCVRRTFEKAMTVAADVKPTLILEVLTVDGGDQVVNRWELS
jgi:hypothetical protein